MKRIRIIFPFPFFILGGHFDAQYKVSVELNSHSQISWSSLSHSTQWADKIDATRLIKGSEESIAHVGTTVCVCICSVPWIPYTCDEGGYPASNP